MDELKQEKAPEMKITTVAAGSEAVDLMGQEPHISVKIVHLFHSDVNTLIGLLPSEASKASGLMGFEAHSDKTGTTFTANFTSTDKARDYVNRAIQAMDLSDRSVALRAEFAKKAESFHAVSNSKRPS